MCFLKCECRKKNLYCCSSCWSFELLPVLLFFPVWVCSGLLHFGSGFIILGGGGFPQVHFGSGPKFKTYILSKFHGHFSNSLCLCCSSGVDPASCSALAAGIPAVLLQSGDDGRSSAGLAQPHLEPAAPVTGLASARLSAALPVGAHTCLPVWLRVVFELINGLQVFFSVLQGRSQSLLAGCC